MYNSGFSILVVSSKYQYKYQYTWRWCQGCAESVPIGPAHSRQFRKNVGTVQPALRAAHAWSVSALSRAAIPSPTLDTHAWAWQVHQKSE